MLSELAAMRFLTEHTDIPVPKVLAYNVNKEANLVNGQWMLVECIKGNTLSDLGYCGPIGFSSPDGLRELNDEQKAKVRKGLASLQVCSLVPIISPNNSKKTFTAHPMDVQVKLANTSVEKIGAFRPLLPNENLPPGSYGFGPLQNVFSMGGPYDSASDLFTSWAAQSHSYLKRWQRAGMLKPGDRQLKAEFLKRLASEIDLIVPDEQSESYSVTLPYLGDSNLLFNDDFELVGVVNWHKACTAPIDVSVAVMNTYAQFNPETAGVLYDEEARKYIADVAAAEEALGLPRKISHRFGSIIGDIGVCMTRFGPPDMFNYEAVLNRAPRIV